MLLSLAILFLVGLSATAIFDKIGLPRIIGMLGIGIVISPYVLDPKILGISSDRRRDHAVRAGGCSGVCLGDYCLKYVYSHRVVLPVNRRRSVYPDTNADRPGIPLHPRTAYPSDTGMQAPHKTFRRNHRAFPLQAESRSCPHPQVVCYIPLLHGGMKPFLYSIMQ